MNLRGAIGDSANGVPHARPRAGATLVAQLELGGRWHRRWSAIGDRLDVAGQRAELASDEEDPVRRRYRRRANKPVIAVRLALDTDGLVYLKLGGEQLAKSGDWVLDNAGDVYTVDHETFTRTYRAVAPGTYIKTTPVWAEAARDAGQVKTNEGFTRYSKGDFLVSNHEDGTDAYAVDARTFESLYELDEN